MFTAVSARQAVGPHTRGHDDFLERRIAGTFADTVDRALDLPRARGDGRERVGDGQAEIVVTMRAERRLRGVRDPRQNGREERADLVRDGKADGIRQIDGGAPGGDDRLDNPAQKLHVAARRVLGRKLHVVGMPGLLDRVDGGLEAGFLRHPQLALEMQVGGGDEGVDAAARRRRQRPTRAVDVGRMTARERGNDGTLDVGRDETHRLGVGLRGDRKPGLDDVDAERRQLMRHLQLLVDAQREAWGLLAVTQRRVEDRQTVGGRHGSRTVTFVTLAPACCPIYTCLI